MLSALYERHNRYYRLKGSRARPENWCSGRCSIGTYTLYMHTDLYILNTNLYTYIYFIYIYMNTYVYLYWYTILEINRVWLNRRVLCTQDNNYYQTVALAHAFEETLVLSWGVCSPQLTTNLFLFIFKRVVVKRNTQ